MALLPVAMMGMARMGAPAGRDGHAPVFLLFLLPPPSPGALRLSWSHGARAWCAADPREAAVMQSIVGNVVLADECDHLLARPVEQRIDLDQPVMGRNNSKRDASAFIRLIGAQSGDPNDGAREGPPERLDLAHRAAGVPRFDRGVKSIDALMRYQRFDAIAIRIDGDNALAVSVLGPRPELESLRKQPAGIEGHHVDRKPLTEDRMRDGLVLDTETRREDDAAADDGRIAARR
jgi:hypothetical protein